MSNVTSLYLNVLVQLFLSFPWNVIQEELTYSLGQVIMKPNIMQNYCSGYSHICFFGYQTKRQYIPNQKLACIPRIQPAIKLFIAPIMLCYCCSWDRLCGLVVRVSGYRYRGPGFDPRRYQIF